MVIGSEAEADGTTPAAISAPKPANASATLARPAMAPSENPAWVNGPKREKLAADQHLDQLPEIGL